MASDQMLANSSVSSKKQQQLEAGKKRLEEFRKKKAAAKKAASTNSANGDLLHETKPPVSDTVQAVNDTSNSASELHVGKTEKKTTDVHSAEPHSTYTTHTNPVSGFDKSSANPEQTYSTDVKLDHDAPYGSGRDHYAPSEELNYPKLGFNGYGMDIEKSRAFRHSEEDISIKSNHISTIRLEDAPNNSRDDRLKDNDSVAAPISIAKSFPERSQGASFVSISSQNGQPANGPTYTDSSSEIGKSLQGVLEHGYNPVSTGGDGNDNNLVDHPVSENYSSLWSSEISTGFRSESIPSHNQTSMSPGFSGRRPRPSFLVSRNSSTSLSQAETDKANPFSSKFYPVDARVSSNSRNLMNSSASVGDLFRQNELDTERKNDFNSTKQNEDFAALEQHIEDLTQEKFSLQRALEASRVLAESLATENSALTDSYNQQGSVVNQLKSDMERLQEEITAQLVELDAVRNEYGNARLECSAADERAKLLASEVIGLEEKALRLRSNELKLERQLENMEAEMSSQKRRISSLEKERQDLQFTIDALQEEKKVLQSKLRKAPAGTGVDIERIPTSKKEASTSTDDLVDESEHNTPATSNLAVLATPGEIDDASSTSFQSQSRHPGFDVSSSSIPPDQMRMIQNINTLISELQLEKEELVQALSTESTLSSKLKDLNKELSQKLEVQTQRLELLTSRSMASDNIPARKAVPHTVVDNTPYADEGDEVVERVLGWIMKLFPGGPSRRQTKHL